MNNRIYKNRIKKNNYGIRSLLLLSSLLVIIITIYLFRVTHRNYNHEDDRYTRANTNTNTIAAGIMTIIIIIILIIIIIIIIVIGNKNNIIYDLIKQQKIRILSDPLGAYYKRRLIFGESESDSYTYITGYEKHHQLSSSSSSSSLSSSTNSYLKSILSEHNISNLNDFDPFSHFFRYLYHYYYSDNHSNNH